MSDSNDPRALDRREFLQLLGAAGLAAVLPGAGTAAAQTSTPPAAVTAPAAPAAPSEDARALTGILARRFPGRFSDPQLEGIARDFDGDLSLGKRMRGLKLANGDEPDMTFKA